MCRARADEAAEDGGRVLVHHFLEVGVLLVGANYVRSGGMGILVSV